MYKPLAKKVAVAAVILSVSVSIPSAYLVKAKPSADVTKTGGNVTFAQTEPEVKQALEQLEAATVKKVLTSAQGNSKVNANNVVPKDVKSDTKHMVVSRGGESTRHLPYDPSTGRSFKLTAYDLNVSSCGKRPGDRGFGIGATGYDFRGQDITSRKIAVDPDVIPLGSSVYIDFPEHFESVVIADGSTFKLDGIYEAVDTGGAIRGHIVDIFVGGADEFSHDLAYLIGRRKVKIYELKE